MKNNTHFRAALMLSIFPPDLREEIVSFCLSRGSSTSRDVIDLEETGDIPAFMTLFSRQYVEDRDISDLMVGFSTIVLDGLKSTKTGLDSYSSVLQTAYGLPESIADSMAKNIETEDDLAKLSPSWYGKLSQNIMAATRQSLNAVMSSGPLSILSWEIDQDQTYDLDMLYEWKLLGVQVKKLNSRVRLMSAQSMIAANIDLFPRPDAVEGGDVDSADADSYIGDLVSKVSAPNFPPGMYGGLSPLTLLHATANKVRLANVIKASGLGKPKIASTGVIAGSHPSLARSLAKFTTGKTSKHGILGFIRKKPLGQAHGDLIDLSGESQDQKGNTLRTLYGDMGHAIAHAYETGDINPLLEQAADLATDDETTGDPDLDDAIISGDVANDPYGDVDEMGQEVGGLFTRMRTNMAIRRAARRKSRSSIKQTKVKKRFARKEALTGARMKAKDATEVYDDAVEAEPQDEEEGDEDESGDNMNMSAFDNA